MRLPATAPAPAAAPEERTLRHLYTSEQIDFVLRRERARSDRHGRNFALALFKLEGMHLGRGKMMRLARVVLDLARNTDEVGWYDSETIAVILPETPADGALRFSHRVCELGRSKHLRPTMDVYTYPEAWFGDGGPCGHDRPTDADPSLPQPADNQAANGTDKPAPAARDESPVASTALEAAPRMRLVDDSPTVPSNTQALSDLLLHPLPWWKRAIDIACAGTGLLLASPVLLGIALAIKVGSPGPVMFKQKRAGLGGRPFEIYKFRTMCVNAEAQKAALRAISEQDGPAFKMARDPRVTRIGALLRKTSLDELPQLINVLLGDMSLVGPRPLPIDEQDGCETWQRRRLDVTPGLTCIWQVKGRSRVTFDEWMRMDVSYIKRRKLWRDVKILAETVPAVLLRRGAK